MKLEMKTKQVGRGWKAKQKPAGMTKSFPIASTATRSDRGHQVKKNRTERRRGWRRRRRKKNEKCVDGWRNVTDGGRLRGRPGLATKPAVYRQISRPPPIPLSISSRSRSTSNKLKVIHSKPATRSSAFLFFFRQTDKFSANLWAGIGSGWIKNIDSAKKKTNESCSNCFDWVGMSRASHVARVPNQITYLPRKWRKGWGGCVCVFILVRSSSMKRRGFPWSVQVDG